MLSTPGIAPRSIESFVQTTDVMPTLLELLGIPFGERDFDGSSLVGLMNGKGQHLRDKVFFQETFWEKKFAVRTDTFKLILARNNDEATCSACHRVHGDGLIELYDLVNDPYESDNRYRDYPALVASLTKDIVEHYGEYYSAEHQTLPEDHTTTVSEEEKLIGARLKDLGYY
jgi:arylsulfatase A-like enzyme